MRNAHGTLETYVGWPAVGNAEYWSSTRAQTGSHYAVHVGSGSSEIEADGSKYLVSCVDKALPAVYPQITLSPQDSPYQTQIGNTIDVTVSVVDKNTQEPLPYRYLELYLDPAINRKGVHDDAWNSHRVVIESRNVTASSPALYTGMTDANGQCN